MKIDAVLLPLVLGIGGLCGYFIRVRIGGAQAERDRKHAARFEYKRRQLDLLLEFLGTPRSEFTTLQGVGNTWDEGWRRERARTVREWVERYRPQFPEEVQRALTRLANHAGTMTVDAGMALMLRIDAIEAAEGAITTVTSYAAQLREELGLDA